MILREPFIVRIKSKLNTNLKKAGIERDANVYMKRISIFALILSIVTLFFVRNSLSSIGGIKLIIGIISYILLFFIGYVFILGLFVFGWINFKKYKRKKKLESILADYLQLVAANVGAGMPIDQAMWYSIRGRFGVLSKEIETVAKKVMSGYELSDSLKEFSEKYDSDILKQTIILLIKGLETGGEITSLISDIAWNIRENQIMKKEINADIQSYVIFISFASLFAAPLLFALSLKLITIMSGVMEGLDLSGAAGINSIFSFQDVKGMISPHNFKIFAFICLGITSLFSSLILSTIKNGNLKDSVKYIPVFIAVSYGLFLILSVVLGGIFSSIVGLA